MSDLKKSILFMIQLPPPVHGAALRNKSLLESEVINKYFTIHALPLRFVDDLKYIGRFSFKKIVLAIGYCFRLIRMLLSKKIDLVYFTMSPSGGAFYRDILFITLLKLFRKKVLLHFRIKGIQRTAGTKRGRMLVRYAFHGSDIICLSKHHLLDFEGLTSRKPYVVPNGIKVEKESFSTESRKDDSGNPPSILFLSNLMRTKGVYELIEALSLLRERKVCFEVSITGKELDVTFTALQELIEKYSLQKLVTITGPKYGADKFALLAAADIFVFPTYFELFPGVVLEAMQFGRPIVTTFEGAIPEIIDNGINGILVPQKDVVKLADALQMLLSDKLKRQELGTAAREKFFKEFTLEKFEYNMKTVFTELTN